tara:strand:+ start:103 stop:852 length:750 start_codon:yes stop_codon:yes gene_type:complete
MGLRTFLRRNFYNLKYVKNKKSDLKDQTILLTGASSGIGLGICKKLTQKNKVYAVYNKNPSSLLEVKNLNLTNLKCDLFDFENYQEIEKQIKENNINLIINCAGQFGSNNQSIENINFDYFLNILKLNALSILKILQLISSNGKIEYLKKIINISSYGGSIGENNEGNAYIYRTSKSALNSISKNLSIDLKKKFGTSVISIDPGNVKTGMNNKGFLSKEKCAEYIIDIICDDKDYNGKFIDLFKKEIPW